ATVSASGSTATLQPSASLTSATTYTATLLAGANGIKDSAGNALASDYTWSFTTATVDQTPPISAVTFPANAGSYNAAGWDAGCSPSGICGSASDAGSGVRKVEISTRRGSATYWNGTSFSSASEVFFQTTGTTACSYSYPASNFPASANYTTRVRATDNAGNVQSPSSRQISFAP